MRINLKMINLLKRHGMYRGELKNAIDEALGPVNLKDLSYATANRPFFYVGWGLLSNGTSEESDAGEDVKQFLKGFTEDQIAQSARWSYLYARYILHSRFKLGEPTMKVSEGGWWSSYCDQVYDEEMDMI